MQHHLPVTWHEEHASVLRHQAMENFWRDADAVWVRVQRGATSGLARSTQRLQARLRHHQAARAARAAPSA